MPTISPTLPNDGETIDAQDVNGPFNAILSVLNGNIDDQNVKPGSLPWSVMDSFSNQIPASAMQHSGNLENFRADGDIAFIPTGLVWSALTGLNAAMTGGEYYSNSGSLLSITAIASRTFTASKDTYVSIGQAGTIGYSEVANGAAQPSLPSNSSWLAKVVTNGSSVTSVTDLRQTELIAARNIDLSTFGAENYSTAEVNTGFTWINGDIIYKKTVLCSGLPNNTSKSFAHSISNMKTLIKLYGWTFVTSGGGFYALPIPSVRAGSAQIGIYADVTDIHIEAGSDRSSLSAYVTLYYTKT